MRLTIIPEDGTVYIDRVSYDNIDMSWVPEIDGHKVHALQWLGEEGEIELVNGTGPNVKITKLGVFEKAIDLWNEKKLEHEKLEQERLLEEERLKQEELERVKAQFLLTSMVTVDESDDEEDELFYDIEELLKEI
jgi:hypothetical protein